jgi:hypothetical protein
MEIEQPQLLADTHVEGEETIENEAFFNDLKEALNEAVEWQIGNGTTRVTRYVAGERIGPEMMTREEFLISRKAQDEAETAEAYTVIESLLKWAGRDTHTPDEVEEVQSLRARAEALLKRRTTEQVPA